MISYAYDTEFIEDGHTIDLVSIGVVDIDHPERFYYAVSTEFNIPRLLGRPWLAENVAPYLPWWAPGVLDASSPLVKSRAQIRDELADFLLGRGEIELWANYGAFDHVVLCWLWGRMADHPDGLPMFTNDLQQRIRHAGVDPDRLPVQDGGLHDALADARHVAACVRWLDQHTTRPALLHVVAEEPAWLDSEQEWRAGCACGRVVGSSVKEHAESLLTMHILEGNGHV